MSGFVGNYEHNLDSKNRVFIPAKLRDRLGETFIIRVKPAKYPRIECFTEKAFDEKVEAELSGIQDEIMREKKLFVTHANASEVTVDSQGRICIPANILKYSGIKKESLFVGVRDCVQIWNPETYNAYFEQVCAENIAEEEALQAQEQKRLEFIAEGRFLEPKN